MVKRNSGLDLVLFQEIDPLVLLSYVDPGYLFTGLDDVI